MAIVGVASVKIKPDLSDFRKELKAGLDAIKAEFTVKVKADTDPAKRTIDAFVARQELKEINKKIDIDRSSIDRAESLFSGLAKSILNVGKGLVSGSLKIVAIGIAASAAAAALVGVVHLVGALAQGLAALAPAGLATGLGALLTLGVALSTIKLGMAGIGRAMDGLNAPIARLREAVQATFERSFTPAVNNLKTVIPQLRGPLQQVATAIGGVATKFTAMLKTSENMSLLKGIIQNSSKAIDGLGSALAPLGHAFLEVGNVATKIFASMTKGLGQVAQEFADKISAKAASGELEKSFRNSIEAVHQLFNAIRDFGAGVGNIFRALTGSIGGSFTDTLANIASKFRSFTELQSTKDLFSTIGDVVGILAGAFKDLLKALGPVLPLLADTAKIISQGLADVIRDLAPLIATVASHFLEMVQKLAPKLLPFIEKLATAFLDILDACIPLLDPLADLVVALTPLIDPIVQLVKNLVPPLVGLLEALAPAVEAVAKALGKVLDLIGPVVGGLTTFLAIGVGTITDILGLTDGNQKTITGVTHAEKLGENIGKSISQGMAAQADAGIHRVLNQMLRWLGDSGPDMEAISQTLGGGAANALVRGFEPAPAEMSRILDNVLASLGIHIEGFSNEGEAISQALRDGMNSQEQAIYDNMTRIIHNSLSILTGGRWQFEQTGSGISQSLAFGLQSGNPAVAAAAQGAVSVIAAALNPVSLYAVGNRIGNSLAAGLQSAVSAVKAVLTSLTIGIPLWKGPPAVDKVLLKPAGIAIMQGLIDGVVSQQDELQRVLGTVTDQFSSTTSGSLSASLNSFVSGDLNQPAVLVNVGLNEGALKGVIDVRIDEGNRQTRRAALTGGTFG